MSLSQLKDKIRKRTNLRAFNQIRAHAVKHHGAGAGAALDRKAADVWKKTVKEWQIR